MEDLLSSLKKVLRSNENEYDCVSDIQITLFEYKYKILLPEDLKLYFKSINGTHGKYDDNFFCFNSLDQFRNIDEELSDWDGIPNYKNLVNTFEQHKNCFVFCDYQFHVFSYAIRLYTKETIKNEVYAVCGEKYKLIADSFTDFLKLYLNQSQKLQF